jgi:Tol biopolymer transport system component
MTRLLVMFLLFLLVSAPASACAGVLYCYPMVTTTTTVSGANIVTIMSSDGLVVLPIPAANCGNNTSGCWPSFSPDGLHMMFNAANSTGSAIYTMNIDGTGMTRISPATGAADTMPSYSPTGTQIVYAHVINPNPLETELIVANVNGTNPVTIVAPVSGIYNFEPRWSSQNQIAFVQGSAGSTQIMVINPDGSGLKQLTSIGAHGEPGWSPDGNVIVFGSAQPPSGNLNVYTMHKDGTSVTQITNFTEPMEAGDPSFSPDGKQVSFEVDDGGNYQSNPTAPATVYIVNADGSNLHSTGVGCADIGCHPNWSIVKQ